jgi:hypothetical protein
VAPPAAAAALLWVGCYCWAWLQQPGLRQHPLLLLVPQSWELPPLLVLLLLDCHPLLVLWSLQLYQLQLLATHQVQLLSTHQVQLLLPVLRARC